MNPKNMVTAVLLLFVAASIVVLAVKSLRQESSSASAQAEEAAPLTDGVIAYYLHSNTRCPTCKNIEAYSGEAVTKGFAEELADGRLQWRVVNYEKPENEHFATDFEIAAPTVVLVRMVGGDVSKHQNLDRVWELVGTKEPFMEYVRQQTRDFLAASGE